MPLGAGAKNRATPVSQRQIAGRFVLFRSIRNILHYRLAGSLLLFAFTRTQTINDDFLVASFMFQGDGRLDDDNASLIIYDGDCIFCHNYVRLMRLRASLGNVELIDARGGDPRVWSYWSQGYDLNTGMLFIHGGKIY